MEMMTAEQAAEAAKGLTFEKVWAALMESRKRMEESDREFKKRMDESYKRMEKTLSDLSKNLGDMGNSIGSLTESMFMNELWKKFRKIGIRITRQRGHIPFGDDVIGFTEVDLFMENGEYSIVVEIKTKMTVAHINDHLKRIEIVRQDMDKEGDKRKLLGAVACGSIDESVLKYAQRKGLYVFIQRGDSVAIADAPKSFKPREW